MVLENGDGATFFGSSGYLLQKSKKFHDRIIRLRVYFWLKILNECADLPSLHDCALESNEIHCDGIKEAYLHRIQQLCLKSYSTAPFPGIYGRSLWILSRLILINSGYVTFQNFPWKELSTFFQNCYDIGSSPLYGPRIVNLLIQIIRRHPLDLNRIQDVGGILSCYLQISKRISIGTDDIAQEINYIIECLSQRDDVL